MIHRKVVAVVAVEAIFRSDPDVAVVVLYDAVGGTGRQSLSGSVEQAVVGNQHEEDSQ